MASRISRRSWRSSASFCRMTAYFAIGRATVDKTSRMEQAITSSRSVKPASDENRRREIWRAWRQRLDHDPEQRPASVDAGSIRLARGRNDSLAFLLEDLLHDGNFLRTASEEPAVLHFFDADHRGIVLQQQRDGEKIVHVFDHNAERGRLPGLQ